jgi:hypothetical protein
VDTAFELKHKTKINLRTVAVEVYPGRNCELFGFLAGVRGNSKPVIALRGLPDDFRHRVEVPASNGRFEFKMLYHQYGQEQGQEQGREREYYMGWHSHSYLTLAELRSASSSVRSAVMSAADFESWDKESDPGEDLLENEGVVMERAEYELRKAHDLLPKDPYTDELEDVRVKVWFAVESPLPGALGRVETGDLRGGEVRARVRADRLWFRRLGRGATAPKGYIKRLPAPAHARAITRTITNAPTSPPILP